MSKIRQDLVLSLSSQFLFKLIGFATVASLARYLNQDDFGKLALALSLCSVCVLFTNLGYTTDAIRRIASDKEKVSDSINHLFSLRIPLLILYFILLNMGVALFNSELLIVTLGISCSVAIKELHSNFVAIFIATRQIIRNILSFGAGILIVLCGVMIVSYFDAGLIAIVSFYVLGSCVMASFSYVQFRAKFEHIRLTFSLEHFKTHGLATVLLFATNGLGIVHFSIDNIGLGFFRPYKEVAIYAAAAQLLEASQFAIRPLTLIMFPICALLCQQEKWQDLYVSLVNMYLSAIALGLFAVLFVGLLSDWIVTVVFSETYSASADILVILYASTPALFVTSVSVFVSASLNREKRCCQIFFIGILLKVVCIPFVSTHFGPNGVAWLNLMTQSFIAGLLVLDNVLLIRRSKQT